MRGPDGRIYLDCRLPFGLATAPAIFSMISNVINDIARTHLGIDSFVYIDDFAILSNGATAERDVEAFCRLLDILGVPLAQDKLLRDGVPSARNTYLGIEFDLAANKMRLPADKRDKAVEELRGWVRARNKRLQDFRRLAGRLAWASLVTPYGACFSRSTHAYLSLARPVMSIS